MKSYVCIFVVVFLWCALIPVFINPIDNEQASAVVDVDTVAIESHDTSKVQAPINLRVLNKDGKTIDNIEIESYTARALSALMDENTPIEALKAQAVAIRSVVCYRHENIEHEDYELCNDAGHCFVLAGDARPDCVAAAKATEGVLLTHEKKAALALSHLSSCVKTESYSAIYGTEVPYLISVPVYDESAFDCYKATKAYNKETFEKTFGEYRVEFGADHKEWVTEIEFTAGNRVHTLKSGGVRFKGATFATLFGLESLCYDIVTTQSGFVINCYGKGNGLGMSRCTAVLMAKEGKAYKDILSHFYPGTTLSAF